MLTVAGCGKPAHLAPLVEIRQGSEGTIYTTVAALGGSHSGALEVTDPFAVCDEERVAIVNGRFLQDAIKTHDRAALRGLTGSDIRIDNGDVSVGETQVHGLDGLDESGKDAAEEIAGIERRARHDGVTKKAARAQAIADHLAGSGLGDKEAYVREYVKQGALWPLSSDDGPDAYRAFHEDAHARMRDENALSTMHDHDAARLALAYEQSGMQLPRDEWLSERAQRAYGNDVESARRGSATSSTPKKSLLRHTEILLTSGETSVVMTWRHCARSPRRRLDTRVSPDDRTATWCWRRNVLPSAAIRHGNRTSPWGISSRNSTSSPPPRAQIMLDRS